MGHQEPGRGAGGGGDPAGGACAVAGGAAPPEDHGARGARPCGDSGHAAALAPGGRHRAQRGP
jgi:hypothetical protein